MKKNVLVLLIALSSISVSLAQRGVRIGYVDMEYILENVEEYREANSQLENKVNQWKSEIELRQGQIDQAKKDLQAEKVLLTEELISEREEEIQFMQKELIDYQQDRFGPNGDLVLQKQRLIQPIQDQVFNEVQKIGANKKYDFIFDKSADVVMLYSEKRHDISELVLRAIARTRKISKPAQKASDRNRLEDFETENEEVSDAVIERQERAKAVQESREQDAEARRAEQLRLREERKKAYEARRKKLLEEREAKRKEREAQQKKKDTVTDS